MTMTPGPDSHARPTSLRVPWYVWLGVVASIVLIPIVGLAILSLQSPEQEIPELDRAQYRAALERWHAAGVDSYDLKMVVAGNVMGNEEVQLKVRRNEVVECLHNNRPQPRRHWDDFTIESQFQMIDEDLAKAATGGFRTREGVTITLHAEFDEELGFPRRYQRKAHGRSPLHTAWSVREFLRVDE